MGDVSELLPVEIGRVERMVTLRGFPGWAELSSSELATLAEISRACTAKAGSVVIPLGGPVDASYSIVEGCLIARRNGESLGRYGPGTAVGGLAAFSKETEGYEVIAESDTTMLEMAVADLEEVFEDRFRVLSLVMRELSRQALGLRRSLVPLAGYPPEAQTGAACPARSLDLVERIFYLRKNLEMSEDVIDSVAVLAKSAKEVRLGPGEWLWRVGDKPDHVFALLCGRVVCSSPEGHLFELGAGDLAGTLDATADVPRWYACQVVDGVVGLILPTGVMMDVLEDHTDLALKLLSGFSRQVLRLLALHPRGS